MSTFSFLVAIAFVFLLVLVIGDQAGAIARRVEADIADASLPAEPVVGPTSDVASAGVSADGGAAAEAV